MNYQAYSVSTVCYPLWEHVLRVVRIEITTIWLRAIFPVNFSLEETSVWFSVTENQKAKTERRKSHPPETDVNDPLRGAGIASHRCEPISQRGAIHKYQVFVEEHRQATHSDVSSVVASARRNSTVAESFKNSRVFRIKSSNYYPFLLTASAW